MGNNKKIIAWVTIVLGVFGAISALMFTWGRKVITRFCESPASLFFGWNLSGSPYCDLVVGFTHVVGYTIVLVVLVLVIIRALSRRRDFLNWLREPKRKRLHLFSGKFHGDTFTLKFIYTEWRYLFRETKASISIPLQSGFGLALTWHDGKVYEPVQIRRWKSYEIDFLRITEQGIQVITQADIRPKKPGEYVFTLHLEVSISLKRELNPHKIDRVLYARVNYQGSNQISIKITDKNPKEIKNGEEK